MPIHATALGKVILAHHRYLADGPLNGDLANYTPATITDAVSLRSELDEIAERGWASEIGELVHGAASIAAPIQDRRGVTIGAIGIAGPSERLLDMNRPRPALVTKVMRGARAVSRELGAIRS